MKNKGFTLVELLAVIAILAILVIMALPAVLRMYRQSRISSFQNEVRTVYRTAQSQFLGDSISLGSGQMIAYTNAGTSVTGVNVVKELDMTGNTDFKYYVLINVDGKILNVRASNGTYSFSKQAADTEHDLKIEDIDVETNNDSTLDSNITTTVCPTTEAVYGSSSANNSSISTCVSDSCTKTSVGTELTIRGENFYVVSSNDTYTVLLAKYALNSDTLRQSSSSATSIAFSNNTYWLNQNVTYDIDLDDDAYNIAYLDNKILENIPVILAAASPTNYHLVSPYNDNGESFSGNPYPYVYDSNSNMNTIINNYVSYLSNDGTSILGRLLYAEEAINLGCSVSNESCSSSSYSWLYNGANQYWLGSAGGINYIWTIASNMQFKYIEYNNSYYIRPVIVVPTSDL